MKKKVFGFCLVLFVLSIGVVFSQTPERFRVTSYFVNGQSNTHIIRYVDVLNARTSMSLELFLTNGERVVWFFGEGRTAPATKNQIASMHYNDVTQNGVRQFGTIARVFADRNSITIGFYEGNYSQNSDLRLESADILIILSK